MAKMNAIYVDLQGREWSLDALDSAERRLVAKLRKNGDAYQKAPGDSLQKWCDFDNYWLPLVVDFYTRRGLTHKEVTKTPVFEIAQDVSGRMAVALGLARRPDYRSRLAEIIDSDFKTSRAFCKATGLSEDMLSHVLAGRKDLSMEALTNALDRIGYTIRFVPREPAKPKSA